MTFEIAPTLEAALQEADRWRSALDLHGPAANQGRAVVFLSALNGTMEELGIAAAEESRIVEVLRLRRASMTVVAEQGDAEALSLMFQLALRTAMRMREIYTLMQD